MPARRSTNTRPLENSETAKLKLELWSARRTIIDLMPETARRILTSYYDCITVDDTYMWVTHIAADLSDIAIPLPRRSAMQLGDRAMCPLCGGQSQSQYEEGFAYPEGLMRHFQGKGSARKCDVVEAAHGLAEDYWDSTFHPRGSAERDVFVAKIEARRPKEPLFVVHPYQPPRLIDEGPRAHQAREKEGLAWAQSRLSTLGFQVRREANRIAFTREAPNAVAYADPRKTGAISIQVFLKPLADTLTFWEGRRVASRTFAIADSRKHGLESQVEKAIADAVRDLAPTLRSVSNVQ